MQRKTKSWIVGTSIVGVLGLWIFIDNQRIQINEFQVILNDLPSEFEGYTILHLSDIHNEEHGTNHKKLVDKIRKIHPDSIVITGDLVDRRRYNQETAISLLKKVVPLAPVYYVTGNHEWWSGKYEKLRQEIINTGTIVLEDEKVILHRGNDEIYLLGLNDPSKYYKESMRGQQSSVGNQILREKLNAIVDTIPSKGIKILLSHRPELFLYYQDADIDLVFSGHAHGGQVRLPGIGGLYAPNQGILPSYTAGIYKEGDCNMVVSRGLGNSVFPIRIGNPREMIVIQLRKRAEPYVQN